MPISKPSLQHLSSTVQLWLFEGPLHARARSEMVRHPSYLATRRLIEAAKGWSAAEQQAWQSEQLRVLVRRAYEHTAAYRKLYDEVGVHPDDIHGLQDLEKLPCVARPFMQDDPLACVPDDVAPRDMYYASTSGSTGVPLEFYLSKDTGQVTRAYLHDTWESFGWQRQGLNAVLRGSFAGDKQHLYKYSRWLHEMLLASPQLSRDTLDRIIGLFQRHNIRYLRAYPSVGKRFADLLVESGQTLDLDLLLFGSENLYAWQREALSQAFPSARIVSWYGNSENSVFAGWCPQAERYHVYPTYGVVEVLGRDGRHVAVGESGQVVVTGLAHQGTPFIRYQTGDLAVYGGVGCDACGASVPMLDELSGRLQELAVTVDGRYIPLTSIAVVSELHHHVRQLEFYQDTPGKLEMRVVTTGPLRLEAMIRSLTERLGPGMSVAIREVDAIPATASGKLRVLDQRLPITYGQRPDTTLADETLL